MSSTSSLTKFWKPYDLSETLVPGLSPGAVHSCRWRRQQRLWGHRGASHSRAHRAQHWDHSTAGWIGLAPLLISSHGCVPSLLVPSIA